MEGRPHWSQYGSFSIKLFKLNEEGSDWQQI